MFASKRRSYIIIVIVGLLLGAVLPNIFNAMGISANSKVIWLLTVINFIGAFVLGWYSKKTYTPWWTVFIFPAIFAVDTFLLRTNEHQYAYYLALTYLFISIIARFHSFAVIDDEVELVADVVDGGFKSNKE